MTKENAWWQTITFDFIKIPKDLFRMPQYSNLSTLAKVLYGFLLDRDSEDLYCLWCSDEV